MLPLIPIGLNLAAQFAPMLMKYFTNSDTAATVASQVVSMAQTITGTSTPEQAQAVLAADPALALEFQTKAMENETVLQIAYLGSVQGARDRDVELVKATGKTNKRASVMLAVTMIALVSLVVVMLVKDIDANTALGGVVLLLIGKFSNAWDTAFSFEFGTNRSSKTKDDTIKALSK